LLKRIEKDFGSFDRLKIYLAKVSKDVDGNGWGILGYQPYTDKLTVLGCEKSRKADPMGSHPFTRY
jgi:Fe-Mn family superoxide dismutase